MDAHRAIKPLRPMRDVHPARNAIVLALLAIILTWCAIVWWDNREAADSIARAVRVWG